MCLVTWPLNESEAGVDLVMIQTSLLLLISKNLHKKGTEVSIETRSTPASLSFKGQVTKHTTVKWTIGISNSNVDIYSDDTTNWETNSDPLPIKRGLQDSLDRTSRWLSMNKMVPNTKKTKHLIIGTVQKLLHSGNPSLDLSLCGTPIEVANAAFRR